MNLVTIYILKILRKGFFLFSNKAPTSGRNWKLFPIKDYANNLIYEAIMSPEPTMVARIGANEMACIYNYIGVKSNENKKRYIQFIKGQTPPWWWNKSNFVSLHQGAGFFPTTIPLVERFCKVMVNDMPLCDIIGSWLLEEKLLSNELRFSKKVMLEDLEPFFSTRPWTKALENKKVLVVHPFAETISKQYEKKDLIFENGLLPEFELITLKAVQSIAFEKTPFKDWFEALEHMKTEIDNLDYDVCILGCGAYGFPLAAHIKRKGKKAIHLGGVTQLLFGIKGSRWEEYIVYPYSNLFNEHWVRPNESETPNGANSVEGGCYW